MVPPPEIHEQEATAEAVVEAVDLDVAHDSDGLLVISLRFPSGARSNLPLAGDAVANLLRELGLDSVEDLEGLRFSQLAPALPTNLMRTAD